MSAHSFFRVALVLLVTILMSAVSRADGASITMHPSLPLLDVAFCAVPSADLSTAVLFVSQRSDCTTTLASAGRPCPFFGGFSFNVTSAAMGVDLTTPVRSVRPVYWCQRSSSSGGVASLVGTLQMNLVVVSPRIYPRGQRLALTFNDATPDTSIIYFGLIGGACPSTINVPGSFVLGTNLTVEVTLPDIYTYVCAWIPSYINEIGAPAMALRNRIRGYALTAVSPSSGAYGTSVVVSTGQAFIFYTALSESPTCSDLPTPVAVQRNGDGDTYVAVTKPVGSYYFCMAEDNGLYYTATNMFSVVEYGAQPNTAYAGYAAKAYPSKSTTSDMEVALFPTKDCSQTPVQGWASFAKAAWNVAAAGTYYACVRPYGSTWPATYSLANAVTVVQPPTVVTTPTVPMKSASVHGVIAFYVQSVTPYRAALSNSPTCTPFYRDSVVVEAIGPVGFLLDSSAADTVYWCVSIPVFAATVDSPATTNLSYAAVHAMQVRGYELNHGPLFPGVANTFTMSDEVNLPSIPSFAFVRVSAGNCSDLQTIADPATSVVVAGVPVDRTLRNVTFPVSGEWCLCFSYDGVSYSGQGMSRVQVYGDAVVAPSSIVPRMTTTVMVSFVQPGQAVVVTDSTNCSNITRVLGEGIADSAGVAAVSVMYETLGTMRVCGTYVGRRNGTATTPVLHHAATLITTNPRVFPAVVERRAGVQPLRVVASGAGTLVGERVFLTAPDTPCTDPAATDSMTLPSFARILPPLQHSTDADTPVTFLTLDDNMIDTRYRACVGTNGTYVDGGTIVVTQASPQQESPASTASSAPIVNGQRTLLAFPATFTRVALVDTYVVVGSAENCSTDLGNTTTYATGSIDSNTGRASSFVAPSPPTSGTSLSLRVCVAPQKQLLNSTYGYMDAGAFTSYDFTAVGAYVQRSLNGGVAGWPELADAALYLVGCTGTACSAEAASTTCRDASTQYPVSARTATSARPSSGSYLLCQRVTEGSQSTVVGSNTTVTVVNDFAITSSTDLNELRVSVAFDVTVTGGDGGSAQMTVQPLSVPCGSVAAESQTFAATAGASLSLSLSAISGNQPIHFCAKLRSDAAYVFEVATGYLHSDIRPSYIAFPSLTVSGTAAVTLPVTTGLQGMLSSTMDCGNAIEGGALTFAQNGAFTFAIPPCGANSGVNVVHFCEQSHATAVYRGSLRLLRQSSCVAGDTSAAIQRVMALPSTPITDFGVDAQFLVVEGLSERFDCQSIIPASTLTSAGYTPAAEEDATFFVCTHPVGSPAVKFTPLTATLTIEHYAVQPSLVRSPVDMARSGPDSTLLTLNRSLPSGYTFFSGGRGCTSFLGDAPGFNTSAASALFRVAGHCGVVSICWKPTLTSAPVAVAQLTSLTTPRVRDSTLALVRGASFNASFAAEACTAAATLGGGAAAAVFLSADGCMSVLMGTTVGSTKPSFATDIDSTLLEGISTVSLCAATPAGVATLIAAVPVAPGEVYPASVTAGGRDVRFFLPRYPSANFWFTATSGADACGDADSSSSTRITLPTLTTDASGYGTVSVFASATTGKPMAVGRYTLCYASSSPLSAKAATTLGAATSAALATPQSPLATIDVVPPSFYDIRGTSFVLGVPSTMTLLGDLAAADLLDGFSPARDCRGLSTSYGSWAAASVTSLTVTARLPHPTSSSGLFLCARVPQNLSIESVPNAWSSVNERGISFAEAAVSVPPMGFDACTNYTLSTCIVPLPSSPAASSRAHLTVVYGDCCSASAQAAAAVVGSGSMQEGGTCSLSFNAARVRQYPTGTTFSLCAWDPQDLSVCATLARAAVSGDCSDASAGSERRGLSGGAVAGIVIGCIIGTVALVAGVLFGLWFLGYWGSRKDGRGARRPEDGWSFGLDDALLSSESRISEDVPPEGNNCGTQEPNYENLILHRSESPSDMRRDVLAQMAAERGGADGEDDVSLDSWEEPRDTNFMDGCTVLTEKYVKFFNGIPIDDPEDMSDFPSAAYLRQTRDEREALFARARQRSRSNVAGAMLAGDTSLSWDERIRQSDVLYQMERSHPFAKVLYIFFDEYNAARTAVEMSEETAFFNLRTLFKSHVAELDARCDAVVAIRGEASVFADDEDHPSGTPPPATNTPQTASAVTVPSRSLEKAWLYRHRNTLEFPWVTNDFRTLVGYRRGAGQRYNYVDWGLTLIDLQAFHPLHRWWSPLLPPVVARGAEDDQDARFDFMRATSVVPFVRRYFMLFKLEYTERRQIESQEMLGLSGLRNVYLDVLTRLDLALCETSSTSTSTTTTTPSSSLTASCDDGPSLIAATTANPLQRASVAARDKLASSGSRVLSSDEGVQEMTAESTSSEEGRPALRRSGHHQWSIPK